MSIENPPAFPTHDQDGGTDPRSQILHGGMSLRDYFAGQALVAIGTWLPNPLSSNLDADYVLAERAAWAYRQAEAMLATRKAAKP